jgi:hypothetical protein
LTLNSLATVLESCEDPTWLLGNSQIQLTVKTTGSVSLRTLIGLRDSEVWAERLSDAAVQAQFDKDQPGELKPGAGFTLKLPRNVRKNVVAKDLADLLSLDLATSQTPAAYFLVKEEQTEKMFCFTGASSLPAAPLRVKGYHNAIEFWTLIKARANYVTSTGSLLFFDVRRTEIMPCFVLNDLTYDISVKEVKKFLESQEKPETRAEIFRSVLSEFLRDRPTGKAFGYLLRDSGLFAQRLQEGWNIYLSKFSPKELTEEAVAKHLDLAEKLEKIIGGMEAKSLTIPAAVLLAVKEVRFGVGWTTLNTIILIASALYLAAMTVAHLSQRATLKLLKTTIAKTKEDLKTQGLAESNSVLTGSFGSLENRSWNSSFGSWAMWIFSWVPLIAVLYAIFFAPPAAQPLSESSPKSVTATPGGNAVPSPNSQPTIKPTVSRDKTNSGKPNQRKS